MLCTGGKTTQGNHNLFHTMIY